MQRNVYLLGAILVTTMACEDKGVPTETAVAPTATAPGTAVEVPPTPAKLEAEPAKAGWEVEVSGVDLPNVTGGSVMTMNMPGPTATYKLTNAQLMGTIDLQNAEVGKAGTYTPYNMNLNFIDEQMTCGMSSTTKDSDLTVTIKPTATGYRGEFQGKVMCKPLTGGDEKPATVTGWFEK